MLQKFTTLAAAGAMTAALLVGVPSALGATASMVREVAAGGIGWDSNTPGTGTTAVADAALTGTAVTASAPAPAPSTTGIGWD